MRKNLRNSNKSYFQLQSDAGVVIARRKTSFLSDGAYLFQDELEVHGVLAVRVITCTAWLLELYELKAGDVVFINGTRKVRATTKCFGVLYPPFTISQPSVENAKGRVVGVAATESLPTGFTEVPTMFETMCSELPTGVAQALEIVRLGENHQSVEMNSRPSLLSIKAKRLIDENYLSYPSISRIAQRLCVSHEHLSRQFKRDFEISPSAYFHQLRLADAPLKLAKGEEIINVSQDVGYNDLSRFYKQFRKTTKTSPGVCQTLMRPNRV
ncbi:MAG: helix-turn-helix transcriptional regulator [Pyrinomonadaceae bacterium]|nr:helix-turn-helix transcriptional regulator [Pyrinomonadaceae bacterium]